MTEVTLLLEGIRAKEPRAIARAITLAEEGAATPRVRELISGLEDGGAASRSLLLGITGPPGCGKSTLTSRLITRYRANGGRVGVIAIDPSSPRSGGALLGDRIRMREHAQDPEVVIRSMATRGQSGGLNSSCATAARILAASGCDPVIVETVGVGQVDMDITRLAGVTILVLAPGFGDGIQVMKAGILEVADILVVNKMDLPGADDLAREIEALARETGRPFCATSATDGTGVEHLGVLVDALLRERETVSGSCGE